MASEGKLPINYNELPLVLMSYETTTESNIFDDRDFATAWFWSENSEANQHGLKVNPMVEELSKIYRDFSKEKRELIYQDSYKELTQDIDDIIALANKRNCDQDSIQCHISQLFQFNQQIDVIEDLSFSLMNIANEQIGQKISDTFKNEIEWVLHPPRETPKVPEDLPTKVIDGENYREYRNQKEWTKKEGQSNLDTIRLAHQLEDLGAYLVLDKRKERLFLYDKENKLIGSFQVDIPKGSSDKRNESSLSAGIFELINTDSEQVYLKDQRNFPLEFQTKESVDCTGSECVQSLATISDILKGSGHKLPLPLYILPYDDSLEFVMKNNQLSFTTYEKKDNYFDYNFSPKNKEALTTQFEITDKEFDTPFAREFLKGLTNEKENLMELYNLDNDEYNELCILAFGILGQESQFGSHWRYKVKETFPGSVAYLKKYKSLISETKKESEDKGLWQSFKDFAKNAWEIETDYITGDISLDKNSRGPTQIKKIPAKIKSQYGIDKEDLQQADKAAVATLGFLAQSLEELKAKEKFHPDINGKTRFEYLHYIYMGKSSEITKGTATPDKNIYYQNVKRYASSLEIWQKEE